MPDAYPPPATPGAGPRVAEILENISDAFLALDREWRVTYLNRRAEELLGATRDELLGRNLWELFPVTVGSASYQAYHRAVREQVTVAFETYGTVMHRWLSVRAYPTPEGLTVYFRDIGEQRRVQEALRLGESLLTRIVATQQEIATAALDPGTVLTLAAERAQELTGATGAVVEMFEGEEMVYRAASGAALPHLGLRLNARGSLSALCLRTGETLHCADVESDPRVDREAARRIGARSMAVVPITHEGTPIGVLKVVSPEAAAFGSHEVATLQLVTGLMGASISHATEFEARQRLLAERTQALQTLRESEERFRTALAAAPIGMALVGLDGRWLEANRALCEIVGYSAKQLRRLTFADVTHPDDLAVDLAHVRKLLDGELDSYRREKRYVHRKGHTVWAEVTRSLVRGDGGAPLYFIAQVQDITERHAAEEMLARAMGELRRSNEELEQFAYVASHDLQEPLRKIQAFGDRLSVRYADALGEHGRDYVARMQGAAGRMQRLIQDLLAFSRVGTKGQRFAEVELGAVAREVLSDLEARLQSSGGQVELGPLPTLTADATQMRQLLQNLIGNALKFHAPGTPPRVRVWGEIDETEERRVARIHVADEGIGFDEAYLDRIFAPFQRLHARSDFEGVGMGLAICKKIAERHGGGIAARSAPGSGASFIITLPIHP